MKLKTYNKENSTKIRKGEARIRFNESGAIGLSNELMRIAGLDENDEIEFHQNEENPEEWYFSKARKNEGFVIRKAKNNGTGTYILNCAYIAKLMIEQTNSSKSVNLKVSETPIKQNNKNYWFIITASAKQ